MHCMHCTDQQKLQEVIILFILYIKIIEVKKRTKVLCHLHKCDDSRKNKIRLQRIAETMMHTSLRKV